MRDHGIRDPREENDMRLAEPSAAECLRMLLEERMRALALLRDRAWEVAAGHPVLEAEEWSSPVRPLYDALAADLSRALVHLGRSLEEALEESARAVATLSGRAG